MSRCPDCGATYSPKGGGHCRGGKWGGCCRTFTSDASGDFHRVGPYDRGDGVSGRVCVDVEDDWRTRRDGTRYRVPWRETPRGWTHIPPMTPEQLAGKLGRVPVTTVEATEGPGGTSTPTRRGKPSTVAYRGAGGAS